MIPKTVILGNIRVPTTINVSKTRGDFLICGGPWSVSPKGEFLRDRKWSQLEHPTNGDRPIACAFRVINGHYFLYRACGGPGRGGIHRKRMMEELFHQFMAENKEAVAA